jgi:hypothetical protein
MEMSKKNGGSLAKLEALHRGPKNCRYDLYNLLDGSCGMIDGGKSGKNRIRDGTFFDSLSSYRYLYSNLADQSAGEVRNGLSLCAYAPS